MNNVAFLKMIQTRVEAEGKKLMLPPEEAEKHQAEGHAFEKEFDELCAKHNMHAQLFAINRNVPEVFKTLFVQRATNGCPVVEMGMGIQHWLMMNNFGKSVSFVMATLTEFLSKAMMHQAFEKNMPTLEKGDAKRGPMIMGRG